MDSEKDQNGLEASLVTNITPYAYRKWYTRIIPFPDSVSNKLLSGSFIGSENDNTFTWEAYLREVRIVDINGNIKKWIIATDDCIAHGCMNGATCIDGIANYTCQCQSGYSGIYCEINVNECKSNPCQNGATCIDGVNSYVCKCTTGYSGIICQTDINECVLSPCKNGSTCIDLVGGYSCQCVPGYVGVNCDLCVAGYTGIDCRENINECSSNPCQYGGVCIDLINRYTCNCASNQTLPTSVLEDSLSGRLQTGEQLVSKNKRYIATINGCTFVIYDTIATAKRILFSLNVSNSGNCGLVIRDDGNVCIHNASCMEKWCSGITVTDSKPFRLVMQNDGNLVEINAQNKIIWSTQTNFTDRLNSNSRNRMDGNEQMISSNGRYSAVFSDECRIELYDYFYSSPILLWNSDIISSNYSRGRSNCYGILGQDGNFCSFVNGRSSPIHCSLGVPFNFNSSSSPIQNGEKSRRGISRETSANSYLLLVQTDGNLATYDANNTYVWSTQTNACGMEMNGSLIEVEGLSLIRNPESVNFTISIWAYIKVLTKLPFTLVSQAKVDQSSGFEMSYIDSNTLICSINDNVLEIRGKNNGGLQLMGNWHNWICSFSSFKHSIYQNGRMVGEGVSSALSSSMFSSLSNTLVIGRRLFFNQSQYLFNGYLRELLVFYRMLNAMEIDQIYNHGSLTSLSPVLYIPLTNPKNSSLMDISGNLHNATFSVISPVFRDCSGCLSQPCQNHGSCYPIWNDSFICACLSPFVGRFCEFDNSPCINLGIAYCQNGGKCVPSLVSTISCVCPPGFQGSQCENNVINECSSSPCMNGGTCIDGLGSYTCICTLDWSGAYCNYNAPVSKENVSPIVTITVAVTIPLGVLITAFIVWYCFKARRTQLKLQSVPKPNVNVVLSKESNTWEVVVMNTGQQLPSSSNLWKENSKNVITTPLSSQRQLNILTSSSNSETTVTNGSLHGATNSSFNGLSNESGFVFGSLDKVSTLSKEDEAIFRQYLPLDHHLDLIDDFFKALRQVERTKWINILEVAFWAINPALSEVLLPMWPVTLFPLMLLQKGNESLMDKDSERRLLNLVTMILSHIHYPSFLTESIITGQDMKSLLLMIINTVSNFVWTDGSIRVVRLIFQSFLHLIRSNMLPINSWRSNIQSPAWKNFLEVLSVVEEFVYLRPVQFSSRKIGLHLFEGGCLDEKMVKLVIEILELLNIPRLDEMDRRDAEQNKKAKRFKKYLTDELEFFRATNFFMSTLSKLNLFHKKGKKEKNEKKQKNGMEVKDLEVLSNRSKYNDKKGEGKGNNDDGSVDSTGNVGRGDSNASQEEKKEERKVKNEEKNLETEKLQIQLRTAEEQLMKLLLSRKSITSRVPINEIKTFFTNTDEQIQQSRFKIAFEPAMAVAREHEGSYVTHEKKFQARDELSDQEALHLKNQCQGEPIGEGSFGRVYRVELHGSIWACKIMQVEMSNIRRIIDEINVNRQIRSKRCVMFRGAYSKPPFVMILSEYCPGGSLAERIGKNSHKPLTNDLRFKIALQIAEGLSDIHTQMPPIVHRDLKPSNVLLDENDDARLCDFGLAYTVKTMASTVDMHIKSGAGTDLYKAPETWNPEAHKGPESDIYSFGILLHELFTGEVPWQEKTKEELLFLHHIQHKSPPLNKQLEVRFPQVYRLISLCTMIDPSKRITATNIVKKLSKIISEYSVKSSASSIEMTSFENTSSPSLTLSSNGNPSIAPLDLNESSDKDHPRV